MAGGAAGERDGRPEDRSLNTYVLAKTYNLMAVTGLGYLALTWSTVVLLGGFVTALPKKDFWTITVISMIQAARIFNDLTDRLFPNYLLLVFALRRTIRAFFATSHHQPSSEERRRRPRAWCSSSCLQRAATHAVMYLCCEIVLTPIAVALCIVAFLYGYGPVACIALSSWRVRQHDYAGDGDAAAKNLVPALDIFYSLVLCQGALFLLWYITNNMGPMLVDSLRRECEIPKDWGLASLGNYLLDTEARCVRDPTSMDRRKLVHYAVDLLGSEAWEDNLSGARMLDVFIRQGAAVTVRALLLPSRPKVQKLIDMLGWKRNPDLREAAACVVANLASAIHLAQFPGAIRCVSSLLSLSGRQITHLGSHEPIQKKQSQTTKNTPMLERLLLWEERAIREMCFGLQHGSGVADGCGGTELILQGLTILERLASDHHNCRDICATPDLLPKIMAPLYSDTLLQDLSAAGDAWRHVVSGSFRVVHQLIQAPGWTGRRLRHEISSDRHAVSNLQSIILHHQGGDEAGGQELQIRATEILTQLTLDLSLTNPSAEAKQSLVDKQLRIFLAREEARGQQQAANPLKATAGRTLVWLSSDSQTHCDFIMRAHHDDDGGKTLPSLTEITEAKKNMVDRLTELLQANNNITYRTRAAQILKNLCTHCALDKHVVKQALLPKILTEMPSCETKPSQDKTPSEGILARIMPFYGRNINEVSQRNDEENQQNKSSDQGDEVETDSATKELQEAFLSLILVIFDKLITAHDFDDAVLKRDIGHGGFAEKLLTMVEGNREQATVVSLRIVKLCGQIYVSLMQRKAPLHHFINRKFVGSLSKALEIMSDLESSMLFAAADLGPNEAVRPLLSSVLKQAQELVPSVVDGK